MSANLHLAPLPPSEHVDDDQNEEGEQATVPSGMPDIIATPPAPEVAEPLGQYDLVPEIPPPVEEAHLMEP